MSSKHAPGTVVWAKIKGYPWWPAKIKKEEEVPAAVLKQKPSRPVPIIAVKFFGTKDYGWISSDNLKPFEEHLHEFNKGRRGVQFDRAVKEASDPNAQASGSEEEMNEVEEDELVSEEEEPPKKTPKRGARKKAETRRKSRSKADSDDASDSEPEPEKEKKVKKTPSRRASSGRRSSRIKQVEEDEEEEEEEEHEERPATRKRKSPPIEESTPKRRRTSRKSKSTEEPVEEKEEEPEPSTPQRAKQKSKPRSLGEKLMYLRHKLQKLTMKDVIGDMNTIDSLMKEVEDFDMNLSLLRETKIGKLMKRVSQLDIDDDPYDIRDRAYTLTKKWRSLLIEDVLSDKQQANEDESEKPDDDADTIPMDVDVEESKTEADKLKENDDSGSEAETEIENQLSSGSPDDDDNKDQISDIEEKDVQDKPKNTDTELHQVDIGDKEVTSEPVESATKPESVSQPAISEAEEPISKSVIEDIKPKSDDEQEALVANDNADLPLDSKNEEPSNIEVAQPKQEEIIEAVTQMDIEPTHTDVIDEPTPLEKTNSSEAKEPSSESKSESNEGPKLDITNGEVKHIESAVEETASQVDQPISETNMTEDIPTEEVSDKPESVSQVENETFESKPDQNIPTSEDIAPVVEETKPESSEGVVKEPQVESSVSQVVEEVNTKSVESENEKPEELELKETGEKTD